MEILLVAKSVAGFAGRFKAGARTANSGLFMLSIEQCRKRLGDKAKDLTDETIENIRDVLYVQAGLIFDEWRKSHCLTSGDSNTSPEVSQRLTPNPLPVGDPVGVKKQGEDKPR